MNSAIGHKVSKSLINEGILSLIFGFLLIIWPQAAAVAFVYIIAGFLLIVAILGVIRGVENIGRIGWLAGIGQIVLSLFGLILGLAIFRHPWVSLAIYVSWIGVWLIIKGLIDIFTQSSTYSKIWAVIISILSVIAGILLIMHPIAAGVAFKWVLGIYSIIIGSSLVYIGNSVKHESQR